MLIRNPLKLSRHYRIDRFLQDSNNTLASLLNDKDIVVQRCLYIVAVLQTSLQHFLYLAHENSICPKGSNYTPVVS